MDKRVVGAMLLFAFAGGAHAATIYEAVRFDLQANRRDVDLKIWISEREARVDVQTDRPIVSFIESHGRIAIIDHGGGVYATPAWSQRAAVAPVVAPASPARYLFTLGQYCKAAQRGWSDTAYQEHCYAGATRGMGTSEAPSRVAEFLRVVTATYDLDRLFERAVMVLTYAPAEEGVPLVIRHFENGNVRGEFRVLNARDSALPRNVFDVPRRLKRISLQDSSHQVGAGVKSPNTNPDLKPANSIPVSRRLR